MITIKNLTKIYKSHIKNNNLFTDIFLRKFKENKALDNVSFEIDENELVGFIGPNGAGKTTTLKILSGILYPSSGNVSVLGFNPFDKKKDFLRQISFIMGQRNQLIWDLPANDTFLLNKEIYEIDDFQFKKTVEELSSLLNCQDLLNKPAKTLSLGERMKMEFIAGLLHQPKIIFFDEPTIGLDIFSQEVIRNFIKEYQHQYKATIILTSHYLEDVKRLVKRLIIINKGKIIYDGGLKAIIDKYSREKRVVITLEKPVAGYDFPKIEFMIEKTRLPEKIKELIQTLPFSDLIIEDEPIEKIIKNFFKERA